MRIRTSSSHIASRRVTLGDQHSIERAQQQIPVNPPQFTRISFAHKIEGFRFLDELLRDPTVALQDNRHGVQRTRKDGGEVRIEFVHNDICEDPHCQRAVKLHQ
jgi:hypothetical protein